MRQAVADKEGHERFSERDKPYVKREQGRIHRKNRASENGNEIDQIVIAKASASEAHLFLNGFQDTSMCEHLSTSCHLSHPGRHGRSGFRRDLDRYRRKRHTTSSPFSGGRRSLKEISLEELAQRAERHFPCHPQI